MDIKKHKSLRYAYDHPISLFGRAVWFYHSLVRPKRYAEIKEDVELLKLLHTWTTGGRK